MIFFFFCLSESQVTFTTVLIKRVSQFRIDKLQLQGNAKINLFWQGEAKLVSIRIVTPNKEV